MKGLMASVVQVSETSPRLGEVVEASSTEFIVHCYDLYQAAPLGALVRTAGHGQVYAVVHNVITSPLEAARRPVARGQEEPDEDAVYRNNPQLPRLLRTEFHATIVGHQDTSAPRYYLPSQPPKIHAFVYPCQPDEVRLFTQRLDFLPLLLAGATALTDEVAAAFLRQAGSVQDDSEAFLVAAGRQVARLLSRDLQRLNILLKNLRPTLLHPEALV